MRIDAMTPDDWPRVQEIYAAGIATGDATFELEPPEWKAWDESHLPEHRLVARDEDDSIVGWAALGPVSDRCVYAGVAENSIYVAPEAQGQGVGGTLLVALVQAAEEAGIWTIQTGIFPENKASLRLHMRYGFR